jgi:hypothetical protein
MELICRMINGFHLGAPHQRTSNVGARLKWLFNITLLENPAYWPDVPKDDNDYPKTPEGWKGYPKHFESCFDNSDFRGIFTRFGNAGYSILRIMTKGHPEAAVIIEEQAKDVEICEDEVGDEVDNMSPVGKIETEMDMDERSFSESPDPAEETMYDGDGNPFNRVKFSDDDQPGQSSWIQTGFGQTKITDDTLARITEYVKAYHKGDMAVLKGYLSHVQPHFSTISERTIKLASLGGIGLARYCIEDLQIDSEVYMEMSEHFKNQSRDALALAARLDQECKELDEQLGNLEKKAYEWRQNSAKLSQSQQRVTKKKRLIANAKSGSMSGFRSLANHGIRPGESHLRRLTSIAPDALDIGIPKEDSFDERLAYDV